ncbi:MAG: hypothetical protein WCF33_01215 [Pseudonocardiaceae bacterium]
MTGDPGDLPTRRGHGLSVGASWGSTKRPGLVGVLADACEDIRAGAERPTGIDTHPPTGPVPQIPHANPSAAD